MNLKWIGAILVLTSCGGFGFRLAASHRREVQNLRWLMLSLDLMECELQYRLTPLPELCQKAAKGAGGIVRDVYRTLAEALERQADPDAEYCMRSALSQVNGLSRREKRLFRSLGRSLGQFDLPGQIKGLSSVRGECVRELDALHRNQEERLRSYQTLGLCAGAALVILFV